MKKHEPLEEAKKDVSSVTLAQTNLMTGNTTLDFPVPKEDITSNWILGTGFDPINGNPLGLQGFSAEENEIMQERQTGGKIDGNYVTNSKSLKATADFTEEAQGSGWGASANEKVSGQLQTSFNSQSVSVWNYGYKLNYSKYINKNGQKLSNRAKTYLIDNGYTKFCEEYGTHFIHSIVYGSACYLQYHRQFNSISMQASYSESFGESYKGFGAEEKMSEQMNVGVGASSQNYTESKQIISYGFSPPSFNTVDDIDRIMTEYHDSEKDDSQAIIMRVSVSSWIDLDDVWNILNDNNSDFPSAIDIISDDLGVAYKNASYIKHSAMNFISIDNLLYTGKSQFEAVGLIRENAANLQLDIIQYLIDIKSGERVIDEKIVSNYLEEEAELYSALQSETSSFTLSWYFRFSSHALSARVRSIGHQKDNTAPIYNESEKVLNGENPGSYIKWYNTSPDGSNTPEDNVQKIIMADLYDADGKVFGKACVFLDRSKLRIKTTIEHTDGNLFSGNWCNVKGSTNSIKPGDSQCTEKSSAVEPASTYDFEKFEISVI